MCRFKYSIRSKNSRVRFTSPVIVCDATHFREFFRVCQGFKCVESILLEIEYSGDIWLWIRKCGWRKIATVATFGHVESEETDGQIVLDTDV